MSNPDLDFVSPNQIRVFMQELEDCLLLQNKFGTDVCEIYAFRMMEHSPTFANNPESMFVQDELKRTHRIIAALCEQFANEKDAIVTFEDGTPVSAELMNSWRFYFQVRPKNPKG